MEVNTVIPKQIVLNLTEQEAEWLHSVMQNPLHNQSYEDESVEDSTMRVIFFNATYPVK